jgi:prepilin-type N-terminal cleavage/methylation domain-containing protein
MKRQAGFTLIEVMIAILLAAVALSGILYLISSTAILASQAKINKEGASLAAKEVERLRNFDFEAIGFPDAQGNEPLGVLPRIFTTSTANTVYSIKYEIEWVDDPNTTNEQHDYKKVRIIVSWSKPRPGKYSLVTYISQVSRRAPGRIVVPPPPELVVPPSPSPNSIVRGSIPIVVRIDEPSMLFSALEIRIGNYLAGEKVSIQPPSSSKEITYYWDTTLFGDGRYEITALAYEARGGTNYRTWYYYVDNSPPTVGPTLSLEAAGVKDVTVSYTTIKDGYETVQTYQFVLFDLYRAETISTTVTLSPAESNLSQVTKTLSSLNPWAFYKIVVRGYSYGRYSPSSNAVFAKTKLELKYVLSGGSYLLSWTPPPPLVAFQKYEVWKKTNSVETLMRSYTSPSQTSDSFRKNLLSNSQVKIKAYFNFSGEDFVVESDYVPIK